jgi:hypothetical protein
VAAGHIIGKNDGVAVVVVVVCRAVNSVKASVDFPVLCFRVRELATIFCDTRLIISFHSFYFISKVVNNENVDQQ